MTTKQSSFIQWLIGILVGIFLGILAQLGGTVWWASGMTKDVQASLKNDDRQDEAINLIIAGQSVTNQRLANIEGALGVVSKK